MAGEAENFNAAGEYYIAPPDFNFQREIAGQMLAKILDNCGYAIEDIGGFGSNAAIEAVNAKGDRLSFFFNPENREIRLMYRLPLRSGIDTNDRELTKIILSLAWETRRANLLIDGQARQVVIFTDIDLLGNFDIGELAILIKKRWREIEELREDKRLTDFVRAG